MDFNRTKHTDIWGNIPQCPLAIATQCKCGGKCPCHYPKNKRKGSEDMTMNEIESLGY